MTQAPTPGPLDSDSVKLLVNGDLLRVVGPFGRLRHGDIVHVKTAGDFSLSVEEDEWSDLNPTRFVFVGRPTHPCYDEHQPGCDCTIPEQTVALMPSYLERLAPTAPLKDVSTKSPETNMSPEHVKETAENEHVAAPVEASGSERDEKLRRAYEESAPFLEIIPDPTVEGCHRTVAHNPARPQPSGETREQCAACYRGEVTHFSTDDGFWIEITTSAGGANEHGLNGWFETLEHYPDGSTRRREYVATDSPSARPAPVASGGQHSSGERERADKLASVLTELIPAVRAYLMTGDVMSQSIKKNTWEPVLKRAQAALTEAAKVQTTDAAGLIETIRTRLLGIAPDDQDVTLEDSDWLLIIGALEGRK